MSAKDPRPHRVRTLMTMAGTFERATSEGAMANEMRSFARQFAEKMGFVRVGDQPPR